MQICDNKSVFALVLARFLKLFLFFGFISYELLIANMRDILDEIQIILSYLEN